MSDSKLNEAIVELEELGWKIAHISQSDTTEWTVEAREGHITSYSNVIITGREGGILSAVQEAIRQAKAIEELKVLARQHGLKGKVVLT